MADPWSVPAARGAALAWRRWRYLLDKQLPMLDLGCGDGAQTAFLAEHLPRVLGIDARPDAGALAGEAPVRHLDLLDPVAVRALHDELGDANVYCRALLSSAPPETQPRLIDAMESLLGARGVMYLEEPTPAAAAATDPPLPSGIDRDRVAALFSGERFRLFGEGRAALGLADGGEAEGYWVMLRSGREGDDFK